MVLPLVFLTKQKVLSKAWQVKAKDKNRNTLSAAQYLPQVTVVVFCLWHLVIYGNGYTSEGQFR